jgi:hypothetical protein
MLPFPQALSSPEAATHSRMKRPTLVIVIGLLVPVGLASALYFRDNIRNLLASGPSDLPTHDAAADSYQKSSGKTANPGADSSDKNQSKLPKDIDGSILVIKGIRQTVNPNFGDCTADQLFKLYSTPIDQSTKGTLIFFDYDNNGTMDYVATNLGDGFMTYASSSSATVEEKLISHLGDEVLKKGGKMYYAQLNWAKIAAARE